MSSQSPAPARHTRGSYAKYICLNCRRRKIRCNLPEGVLIVPSQTPQPPELACMRCKQQNLDCIVDKTVLGRPSHKRQRPEDPENEHEVDDEAPEEELDLDPDVQDFVLAEIKAEVDEIEDGFTAPARLKPTKQELFASLMDAANLFAALMSNDARFGSVVFSTRIKVPVTVLELVDAQTTRSLDELLVWHRLHCPQLPTLWELRDELEKCTRNRLQTSPTEALFALLSLLAIEVPCAKLETPKLLWYQLQTLVQRYAQDLLINMPVHQHTLLVLDVINTYRPLALASRQVFAASSLKGNLSAMLGMRTAQKLGLHLSSRKLEEYLQSHNNGDVLVVKSLLLDSLQWCRWVMIDSIMDAYVLQDVREQHKPLVPTKEILCIVKKAIESYRMPPNVVMLYHLLTSAHIEMQAAVALKQNWLSLTALGGVIESHGKKCAELRTYIKSLLDQCDKPAGPPGDEQVNAVIALQMTWLDYSQTRVGGLSIFYALMSGLRAPNSPIAHRKASNVTPGEALQLSSEIITNLKDKHDTLRDPTSVASFISKHGEPRFEYMMQILKDFVASADSLKLNSVPYVAPAMPSTGGLLFICREVVENNATRRKGWGGLHPDVDVHILLLQDVAKRMEAMDALGGGSEALEKGSIYAAGAKLVKSLCSILVGWRREIAEREAREVAERSAHANVSVDEFDGVDMFLSGELLNDWGDWPQAQDLDFQQLFADGADWTAWAEELTPSDDSII